MKIVFIANNYFNILNFRKDLILKLVSKYPNNKVYVLAQRDGYEKKMESFGNLKIINIPLISRSTDVISNIKTFILILYHFVIIRPNLVISYTIKPNIICLFLKNIFFYKLIINITGFGELFLSVSKKFKFFFYIFIKSLNFSNVIIVQNQFDKHYLINKSQKISNKIILIPGSGVNTNIFKYSEFLHTNKITITFIGRIIKEKGVIEFLNAIIKFKRLYPNNQRIDFLIIGEKYKDNNFNLFFDHLLKISKCRYIGHTDDIYKYIKKSHFLILPSYREGLSKVLIESLSSGRPIIASDVPGCKDLVINNINGYLIKIKTDSILNVFNKILKLDDKTFSFLSRNSYKSSLKFSSSIIIEEYMKIVDNLLNEK